MNVFFYIDGGDLMCEMEHETYKIAEEWEGNGMCFETLDGLMDIYGGIPVTKEILDRAIIFAEDKGYRIL